MSPTLRPVRFIPPTVWGQPRRPRSPPEPSLSSLRPRSPWTEPEPVYRGCQQLQRTGAQIVEVPTTTGLAPSVLNTGGLLDNPIALAFDYLGNLYIGDAGPGGLNASSSQPGYIVKVPVGGAPFKMTIPPINGGSGPIIFPQALATDPYTAALLIGDGGNPGAGAGQVVQVTANGSSAGTGPVNGVTNPTGLAFDQAEDLYILDGTANTITVVGGPTSGTTPWLLAFDNTTLPLLAL